MVIVASLGVGYVSSAASAAMITIDSVDKRTIVIVATIGAVANRTKVKDILITVDNRANAMMSPKRMVKTVIGVPTRMKTNVRVTMAVKTINRHFVSPVDSNNLAAIRR
jgi:purine-nucleoside phosphorylase